MTVARKICVIGDFAVGKTSLIRRYISDEFSADYCTTIGVKLHKYSDRFDLGDGSEDRINLVIWDIEGAQENTYISATYFQGASGAVIVGDVTRPEAAQSLIRHARAFQANRPGAALVFALNKIDLVRDNPPRRLSQSLQEEFGEQIHQTSAANAHGVRPLFRRLARKILTVPSLNHQKEGQGFDA